MTERGLQNREGVSIIQDGDNNAKNKAWQVSNATDESGKWNDQSSVSQTKDIGTEAIIETDNVHVTAEIYSVTDLPSSLQTNDSEPGTITPECYDGKCVILRTSRSKSLNTEGSFRFIDRCLSLKCIFPFMGFKKKRNQRERKEDEVNKSSEIEVFQSEPVKTIETRNIPICEPSCPNLIISQGTQTDGKVELAMTLEEQGDSERIASPRVAPVKQTDGGTICTNTMNLSTIPEEEIDSIETASVLSGTKGSSFMVSDGTQMETEEDLTSVGVSETEEKSIQEKDAYETQDIAVDAMDLETETIESLNQKMVSTRKERRTSTNKFETGTIISSQSIYLNDTPRRRRDCKEITARLGDCVPCSSVTNHTVQCEMMSHSMMSQPVCESYELSTLCSRCANRTTRSSIEESTRRMDSTDYWTSNSHRFSRRNNAYGYSMAGEPLENYKRNNSDRNNAWSQYYLNFNKTYNIGRRNNCWCNNGCNPQNTNTAYHVARNQTVYYTPASYSYCFNSWY